MKNLFKIFALSLLVFTIGCENENDTRFQDDPESGWLQFSSPSTTVAVTSRTTSVNIPVQFTAPINLSDVEVSYSVTSVAGDPSLVVTGLGTSLTIEGNTNRASITLTPVDDAVQQLIDNGDVEFDITLTAATRGIPIGLSDGSATVTHRVNLLCGGEPQVGTYVVEMHDTYGDGWQTDDGNGGSGMTVTLLDVNGDETVVEFGMCSPWGAGAGTFLGGGDCQGPPSLSFYDATALIEIPSGTVDAIWNFPGDWWGEISFEIYLPNGNLLYASGGPGDQEAGELQVSYCQ